MIIININILKYHFYIFISLIYKMVKVISVALWGDNPTYTIGTIKNAEQFKRFYTDYEYWVYIHKESVPHQIIERLKQIPRVKLIFKQGDISSEKCKPRMWRFEAIDDPDVEVMVVRDTDTRFYLREKLAVDEWLKSNTLFHIMRDHPHHCYEILGGMFGTKKIPEIKSWKELMEPYIQTDIRMYDQNFLREKIYPVIKNNSMIHASFHRTESHAKPFPINYDSEYHFIGEYVYADDSRSPSHIQALKYAL
jgi:hypothetical protein